MPEIRGRIIDGSYSADLIGQLPGAVRPGERVLVIGAGLGAVSSLIAKAPGVQRVIAAEANSELVPYLRRTHALNGVGWVETINAVLSDNPRGRVPFFARHDIRSSSLVPDDCSWQLAMIVPCMDVNLILAEERISLLVCELPTPAMQLAACSALGSVDRVLVGSSDMPLGDRELDAVCSIMDGHGFEVETGGASLLFGNLATDRKGRERARA